MAKRRLRVVTSEPTALEGYDDLYLDCRGLSHLWANVGFFRDSGFISRLVRCGRCGCEKIVTMRQNGALVQTRYHHPEGYLIKNAEEPVTKADVRLEVIKRASASTFNSLDELRSTIIPRRKSSSS